MGWRGVWLGVAGEVHGPHPHRGMHRAGAHKPEPYHGTTLVDGTAQRKNGDEACRTRTHAATWYRVQAVVGEGQGCRKLSPTTRYRSGTRVSRVSGVLHSEG